MLIVTAAAGVWLSLLLGLVSPEKTGDRILGLSPPGIDCGYRSVVFRDPGRVWDRYPTRKLAAKMKMTKTLIHFFLLMDNGWNIVRIMNHL